MWLAGALGVTVALGYYLFAVVVAVLALVVLTLLKALGHHAEPRPERQDDA
jgi:putative Mg2+ transporter-C (MgtC) family protein